MSLSSTFSSSVTLGEATPDFPFAKAWGPRATPRLPLEEADGEFICQSAVDESHLISGRAFIAITSHGSPYMSHMYDGEGDAATGRSSHALSGSPVGKAEC